MRTRYCIIDWAGNFINIDGQASFDSFEHAWQTICYFEPDEDALDDYEVINEAEARDLRRRTMLV